jgi:hypothetical protein
MNQLLSEIEIYPEDGQVRVEALGSQAVPDDVDDDWFDKGYIANETSVYVITMTADEAEDIGSSVRTRVYRGSDTAGLGKLIFDQQMVFRDPVLTLGRVLDDVENLHKVPVDRTGPVRIQIFTVTSAPVEGPNEVNVLIRADLAT